MRLITILIILTSCAHSSKDENLKKFNYSKSSVIQLAKTAFIKGCIEGKNIDNKKLTQGIRFQNCKLKAKEYENDLKALLK